jgi:vitamin B12/bleomycin/antimicrobial peptide transport system ATP-binding/permease protein
MLVLMISLNLGLVFVSVLINQWNNLFFNAIEQHDLVEFAHQLLRFFLLAGAFIVVAVHQTYFTQLLEVRWRRWLTGYVIRRWFDGQTYHRMQMQGTETDNPDQRIAEDLRLFVGTTLTLSMGFLSSLVTLCSFITILWQLSGTIDVAVGNWTLRIPGYMAWAAFLYSMFGTLLTHWVGHPLAKLNFTHQTLEADFRFSLIRLRENADGIAFYRGEAEEERTLAQRFQAVFQNWRAIISRQKRIAWFTTSYSQLATVFPLFAAAPRFLTGAISFGGLTQSVAAFGQVQMAMSWFINVYGNIAEWRATVDRLNGFCHAIEQSREHKKQQTIHVVSGGERLLIDELTLTLPDGRPLLNNVSIHVKRGETVLLMGPSGSGKSTLMRGIAELWPFGHGRIVKPSESMLFLPQRPYLPVGTLRQVVTYPNGQPISDDALQEALELCGLSYLMDRLDVHQNWSQKLSTGEQQRIAFSRALLLRPQWLFFDEATGALDEESEAELYRIIKQRLPGTTIFSVSHRQTLAAFHDRLLETRLSTEGWIVVPCTTPARARVALV